MKMILLGFPVVLLGALYAGCFRSPSGAQTGSTGGGEREPLFIYSVADGRLVEVKPIVWSDEEWRSRLTPEQYRVTRQGGTECAYTGALEKMSEVPGVYRCICCGTDLFLSQAKFHSGSGWPSFFQPVHENNLKQLVDSSHGMRRVEVQCARCGAHLGHVFQDGPPPTGLRFCINSAALRFDPLPEKGTE